MQELQEPLTHVDQQVAILVTFKVKPEQSDVFQQALLNDLIQARQESGYVSMHLFAAKADPSTLFLLERWQDQKAFDRHLSQPYTQAVLDLAQTALTQPMEICALSDLSIQPGIEKTPLEALEMVIPSRSTLAEITQQYDQTATALEAATKHLRMTAEYFRESNLPRGCAHAFAAQEHFNQAQTQLAALASLHAAQRLVEPSREHQNA